MREEMLLETYVRSCYNDEGGSASAGRSSVRGASFCPVCGEKMERTNQSAVNMQQYPNTYNGMVPPYWKLLIRITRDSLAINC